MAFLISQSKCMEGIFNFFLGNQNLEEKNHCGGIWTFGVFDDWIFNNLVNLSATVWKLSVRTPLTFTNVGLLGSLILVLTFITKSCNQTYIQKGNFDFLVVVVTQFLEKKFKLEISISHHFLVWSSQPSNILSHGQTIR